MYETLSLPSSQIRTLFTVIDVWENLQGENLQENTCANFETSLNAKVWGYMYGWYLNPPNKYCPDPTQGDEQRQKIIDKMYYCDESAKIRFNTIRENG